MKWHAYIFLIISLIGAINLVYQVYKITVLDARARGLKHPKFWGLFVTGGNNSSGLLVYLIGRRKYPTNISEEDTQEIEVRKKKTTVCLLFLVVGFIGLAMSMFL